MKRLPLCSHCALDSPAHHLPLEERAAEHRSLRRRAQPLARPKLPCRPAARLGRLPVRLREDRGGEALLSRGLAQWQGLADI